MDFPDIVLTTNIHKGLKIYHDTPEAVLVDVRDRDEYAKGYIIGSINVPLGDLEDEIYDVAPDMAQPIFLCCVSGNRSIQAAAMLRELGFDNAVSIGGIQDYKDYLEKSE